MVIERYSHLSIELGRIDRLATRVGSPDIEKPSVGSTGVIIINFREAPGFRRTGEVSLLADLKMESDPTELTSPQLLL